MKPTEAAALLTICAAYDNRKPDADQARAWALVLDGQRFEDCREAIVNHYRTSREWLMPVNVIDGVQAIRIKRLEDFQKRIRLEPPAHLADDPANEIAWFNSIYSRVMDGEVIDPNEVDERGELKPRDVASLGMVGREMPGYVRAAAPTREASKVETVTPAGDETEESGCACGCPAEMHIGEIGCPCALPGEPPCHATHTTEAHDAPEAS